MKAALKQAWIKALRSGDFEQGINYLHKRTRLKGGRGTRDTFCCLGVLCVVAGLPGSLRGSTNFSYWDKNDENMCGFTTELPPNFKDESGLNRYVHPAGSSDSCDWEQKLIDMNDSGLFSFDEIANYIEANIPSEE